MTWAFRSSFLMIDDVGVNISLHSLGVVGSVCSSFTFETLLFEIESASLHRMVFETQVLRWIVLPLLIGERMSDPYDMGDSFCLFRAVPPPPPARKRKF